MIVQIKNIEQIPIEFNPDNWFKIVAPPADLAGYFFTSVITSYYILTRFLIRLQYRNLAQRFHGTAVQHCAVFHQGQQFGTPVV